MGLGRQLVGWIAAYALVLYAVLGGLAATQLAATHAASPGFELCLADAGGADGPGNSHNRHDNCAIHCSSINGAVAPALVLALLALLFAPSAGRRITHAFAATGFDLLRRAGLGSRAPPLPA